MGWGQNKGNVEVNTQGLLELRWPERGLPMGKREGGRAREGAQRSPWPCPLLTILLRP